MTMAPSHHFMEFIELSLTLMTVVNDAWVSNYLASGSDRI